MKPDLARTIPLSGLSTKYQTPAHALEAMTLEIHRLIAEGQGDTPEADTLRDSMYETWNQLSQEDRTLLDNLSGDLFMLQGEENLEVTESAEDYLRRLSSAGKAQDWRQALELIRYRLSLDEHLIAYFRGRCYAELGYHQAALAFFMHAECLSPTNDNYRYLTLDALLRVRRVNEALERANAILRELSPSSRLLFKAADVLFHAAREFDVDTAKIVYQRVLIVLARAFVEDGKQPHEQLKSVIAGGHVVAGFCHEHLGDVERAVQAYTLAIQVDPDNDAAMTARGLLHYGTERTRALRDFERAASIHTVLVWPYFFLAVEALENQEYARCVEMADHAIKRTLDPVILANLYEWIGIATAYRGGPSALAIQYLRKACSLDPFNERLTANLRLLTSDESLPQFSVANDVSPLQASESLRQTIRLAA